jgi:hypothetical protein
MRPGRRKNSKTFLSTRFCIRTQRDGTSCRRSLPFSKFAREANDNGCRSFASSGIWPSRVGGICRGRGLDFGRRCIDNPAVVFAVQEQGRRATQSGWDTCPYGKMPLVLGQYVCMRKAPTSAARLGPPLALHRSSKDRRLRSHKVSH